MCIFPFRKQWHCRLFCWENLVTFFAVFLLTLTLLSSRFFCFWDICFEFLLLLNAETKKNCSFPQSIAARGTHVWLSPPFASQGNSAEKSGNRKSNCAPSHMCRLIVAANAASIRSFPGNGQVSSTIHQFCWTTTTDDNTPTQVHNHTFIERYKWWQLTFLHCDNGHSPAVKFESVLSSHKVAAQIWEKECQHSIL